MNHNFWVFAFTSLLLNLMPGNDMIYVASRSAGQGVRAGIISAMGIMVGCGVHVLAAVAGLSAILAGSATAFTIVKFTGAAYLIYLGAKSFFNRQQPSFHVDKASGSFTDKKMFIQGVVTNVLNPKVALFFLAFLPQFIDKTAVNTRSQILFLGIWFNIGGTLVNILVAVLFGKIGKWLGRSPRFLKIQEKITGLVLITLGIRVAFTRQS